MRVFHKGKLALHLLIVPTCILSLLILLGNDWFSNVYGLGLLTPPKFLELKQLLLLLQSTR